MTNENEVHIPRVSVTFTRSSTKDGGRGYTIQVQEGVSVDEVKRVFDMAKAAQEDAEQVIRDGDG